jgi:signal transduction histidine kinase
MEDTFRIAGRVPGHAVTLRWALAEAFDDPTLEVAFPSGNGSSAWIDSRGRPLTLPNGDSGRAVSEVRESGKVVAAIVHDAALGARPELVRAGVAMAGVVLDNQRLAAETAASLREVRRSRARIAATAERERRRIERDLHDGAQQRLVALRIELELAGELVRRDPERGALRLRELEQEVDDALEEVRTLAHGVYPPLLSDRGLPDALRDWAGRCSVPVKLETHDVARYPPEVESAVYFCVLEALQNVLKHAAGARRALIRLDGGDAGELRFSVHDDGAGAPGGVVRAGAGITNMRDRLSAIEGDVTVSSSVGAGTVVRGHVPTARLPDLP